MEIRVLIVEDSSDFASALAQIMYFEFGLQAVTIESIQVLQEYIINCNSGVKEPPHILISDKDIHGGEATDLAKQLKDLGVYTVTMSGADLEYEATRLHEKAGDFFLKKTFLHGATITDT